MAWAHSSLFEFNQSANVSDYWKFAQLQVILYLDFHVDKDESYCQKLHLSFIYLSNHSFGEEKWAEWLHGGLCLFVPDRQGIPTTCLAQPAKTNPFEIQ